MAKSYYLSVFINYNKCVVRNKSCLCLHMQFLKWFSYVFIQGIYSRFHLFLYMYLREKLLRKDFCSALSPFCGPLASSVLIWGWFYQWVLSQVKLHSIAACTEHAQIQRQNQSGDNVSVFKSFYWRIHAVVLCIVERSSWKQLSSLLIEIDNYCTQCDC